MQLNQPYDPRYNPKVYVPKLTEEQRLARATPLENLRSLRFRSQTPAAPPQPKAEAPSPTQTAPTAPSTSEAPAPVPVPTRNTPEPRYVPSAREVVFAEFPELYPERCEQVHGNTHLHELCLVGTAPTDDDPACEPRCANQTQTRPRYARALGARVGEHERSSASPLIQSFRFGSNPGAPPHSPPRGRTRARVTSRSAKNSMQHNSRSIGVVCAMRGPVPVDAWYDHD